MQILKTLSYFFNPFDSSYHAIDNLKKMKTNERIKTIFKITLTSICTLFIGTIAAFRYFTHKTDDLSKREKETTVVAARAFDSLKGQTPAPNEIISSLVETPKPEIPPEDSTTWEDDAFSSEETEEEPVIDLSPENLAKLSRKELDALFDSAIPDSNIETKHTPEEIKAQTKAQRDKVSSYIQSHNYGTLGESDDTGDCFFDSIAQILTQRKEPGTPDITKKDIRVAIFNYLTTLSEAEKTSLDQKLTSEGGFDYYKKYICLTNEELNEMRAQHKALSPEEQKQTQAPPANPVWGGDFEIPILSQLFKCNIVIIDYQLLANDENPESTIIDKNEDLPTLYIVFFNKGDLGIAGHFDPVLPPLAPSRP